MDVDQMLKHVGDFGRYQWLLMGLFAIINIFSAFHYFAQTFISVIPGYQCNPLLVLNDNLNNSANTDRSECCSVENSAEPCMTGWNYTLNYEYSSIVDEVSSG